MFNLAGNAIRYLFNRVEDSMECRDDIKGMLKLTQVRLNVNEAMKKYNDIIQWNSYKTTEEFAAIKMDFESIYTAEYPEIITAYRIFLNPCLVEKLN